MDQDPIHSDAAREGASIIDRLPPEAQATALSQLRSLERSVKLNWRVLLNQYSLEFLKRPEIANFGLPDEVVKSGWLGFPGATEDQIKAAEARLGRSLPPSYRTFLKVSNGFRNFGTFIYRMWSVEAIDWFYVGNQDWIDAYLHPESHGYDPDLGKSHEDSQDASGFRLGDLRYCLEISDVGDSAIMLLNPQVTDETGEWEAVFFANWIPGAHTYEDFGEMAQSHIGEYYQFAAEDRRIYSDRVLRTGGLSGLIQLFTDRLSRYSSLYPKESNVENEDNTGLGLLDSRRLTRNIMDAHEAGLRDGMEEVLTQVRALNEQPFEPAQLRQELVHIVETTRAEAQRGQAESQSYMLSNLSTIIDAVHDPERQDSNDQMLRRAGKWQGLGMGASLIESFLQRMNG